MTGGFLSHFTPPHLTSVNMFQMVYRGQRSRVGPGTNNVLTPQADQKGKEMRECGHGVCGLFHRYLKFIEYFCLMCCLPTILPTHLLVSYKHTACGEVATYVSCFFMEETSCRQL